MRIWHKKLIPKLCRQHLLGVWREGLGAYNIVQKYTHDPSQKIGYANHPATKEFLHNPTALVKRLVLIRKEMLKRGYKPKELPEIYVTPNRQKKVIEWQTLEEQVEILKSKNCECKV